MKSEKKQIVKGVGVKMNLGTICPSCDDKKKALIKLPVTVFKEDGQTYRRQGYSGCEVMCFDCLKAEVEELGEERE
ncbi:hypothetical protein [Aneurinibacillus aneurinilyticus]|uniref:Uncharacterized protein n=1 Tax=Aneurinibacillus aneurinilyticus ATCC 12856 TaxID=649747 RepID=U1X0G4_ANEAE|nr:hypothetical protein [Aneurinibacillus aneurinilyticus]ERI08018.1 hypothetical protein HMPREF0083_03904 [Aneurinibacillus aneurinilyticus ATCC 12856]MED0707299.1 hypothetical protein [Aneurinibacillus aneurinilyticus]MED0722226.1 hypothetical protein [Aneurinibacillus aneurinilyticus]MED0730452.1 hypothetical protein [Aneurinibacillus aneurinilyticus]MED0744226.1 hypothetical protein [Aneurinibacillus aneurinilyticus]